MSILSTINKWAVNSKSDEYLNLFFSSSYYKKILAKQHEMNDAEGDTTEYIHDPRCSLDIEKPQFDIW